MADLHKYTSKEVLNKVLLDSSGSSVAAFSHTSAEALNAALDATNSRLNVSLAGGTITGDVTITGDLTVNSGTSSLVFDESVVGDMSIKGADGGVLYLQTSDTEVEDNEVLGKIAFQAPNEAGGTDAILIGASIHGEAEDTFANDNNSTGLVFSTNTSAAATERMRITSAGNVGIGTSAPVGNLFIKSDLDAADDASMDKFAINIVNEANDANEEVGIGFRISDSTPFANYSPGGAITFERTGSTSQGQIHLKAKGSTSALSLTTAMTIDATSNVFPSTGTSTTSTVFGKLAGDDLAAGAVQNTFIGENAGHENKLGDYNTAIGYNAFSASYVSDLEDVDCSDNVFIGAASGSGTWVTAESKQNVAVGSSTMTGAMNNCNFNTVVGYLSGGALTTADGNTCIGWSSNKLATDASWNTSMGSYSLFQNRSGLKNVAIGYGTMYGYVETTNTKGFNTAVGSEAGFYLGVNAERNTFVGSKSGQGVSSTVLVGGDNTCIGEQSGLLLQGAAHSNTFVGGTAGNTTTIGVENTLLGFACDAQDADAENQVVIGNNLTGTKDNAVFIGNDTSHIENDFNSDATWNHSSDRRQKKDIKDDSLGLSFINDLRTVTYKHKSPSEFPQEWDAYNPDDKEPMGGDKVIHGFIAQEVKEALDKADVDTFQGWDGGSDGRQRVSFEAFVMPLIRAVQELSAKVDELDKKCNCK